MNPPRSTLPLRMLGSGQAGHCARLRVIVVQRLKLLVRVSEVFNSGLQRQYPCFSAPLLGAKQVIMLLARLMRLIASFNMRSFLSFMLFVLS